MSDQGWTDLPFDGNYSSGGWTDPPTSYEAPYDTSWPGIPYALPDSTSGEAWNVDNLLKVVNAGVTAYGQIKAIDHGGYSAYGTPPPPANSNSSSVSQSSGDVAPGDSSGFDWSKLTDFSTPYPYVAGFAGILGLALIMRAVRR